MFTAEHFAWMALCILLILGLTALSQMRKFSFHTAATVMACIALCSEISKIITDMRFVNGVDASAGMVIDAGSLPLHLCSMLIFVFFYLPFCKNEQIRSRLSSFIVPVGIFGSILAILFATSGTDFRTSDAYQCFLYHAGMLWFSLYLLLTKQAPMGVQAWLQNVAAMLCLSVIMIWVNGLLQAYDTNFLYVVRPPLEGLPVLNLNNGWYAYLATIVLSGIAGLTAIHLPFILKEKRRIKV